MRYVTLKERFDTARTTAQVRDAVVLIATEIGDALRVVVGSQQCRRKVGFVWYLSCVAFCE